MIPEVIKQKIDDETWRFVQVQPSWSIAYNAIAYGYSLAQEEIERLKEENARLRRYLDEYDKDYAKRHGIV